MDFSLYFPYSVSLKKTVSHLDFFFLVEIFGSEYMHVGSSIQETGVAFTWKWLLQSVSDPHLLYFLLGHEHKTHTLL